MQMDTEELKSTCSFLRREVHKYVFLMFLVCWRCCFLMFSLKADFHLLDKIH